MTNQELQTIKNKFDIIGNDPALNRALEIALAVAPTDITVLVRVASERKTFPASYIRTAVAETVSTLP